MLVQPTVETLPPASRFQQVTQMSGSLGMTHIAITEFEATKRPKLGLLPRSCCLQGAIGILVGRPEAVIPDRDEMALPPTVGV